MSTAPCNPAETPKEQHQPWWMKGEWTAEHFTAARRLMKRIHVLPPDRDEDVIQTFGMHYPNAKKCNGRNPEAWLFSGLLKTAITIHRKEQKIRAHRGEGKPKISVPIEDVLQECSTVAEDVDPVMAHFLLDPVDTLKIIERRDSCPKKWRRLVLRATLNDWTLTEGELSRAAEHCFECNGCLDIYRYFGRGELKPSLPFSVWEEIQCRMSTRKGLLIMAEAAENVAQRKSQGWRHRNRFFLYIHLAFAKKERVPSIVEG